MTPTREFGVISRRNGPVQHCSAGVVEDDHLCQHALLLVIPLRATVAELCAVRLVLPAVSAGGFKLAAVMGLMTAMEAV